MGTYLLLFSKIFFHPLSRKRKSFPCTMYVLQKYMHHTVSFPRNQKICCLFFLQITVHRRMLDCLSAPTNSKKLKRLRRLGTLVEETGRRTTSHRYQIRDWCNSLDPAYPPAEMSRPSRRSDPIIRLPHLCPPGRLAENSLQYLPDVFHPPKWGRAAPRSSRRVR